MWVLGDLSPGAHDELSEASFPAGMLEKPTSLGMVVEERAKPQLVHQRVGLEAEDKTQSLSNSRNPDSRQAPPKQ